ncbi:TPA: hypothetical protein ACK3Q6_005422 [Burkholderia cepacia]|uniref:hypothetical protein n=1 Tax=Burkholderia cepacia TaxID=292 RepID=UPI001CF4D288|nr:hypothetical protein [Burkholderia cepacia]MCA8355905.1 hypothetical protein [Burkholderia cepacia]HDR9757510.1 hypothetical protein [Burkholderia cepacia ATCC 25416]HDV6369752.1 hypothetical protein [Burkholderia cepacia]
MAIKGAIIIVAQNILALAECLEDVSGDDNQEQVARGLEPEIASHGARPEAIRGIPLCEDVDDNEPNIVGLGSYDYREALYGERAGEPKRDLLQRLVLIYST